MQSTCAQHGNQNIHFHLQLLYQYITYNTSVGSMDIPDLCFVLYHWALTLAVAVFIFHGKLTIYTSTQLSFRRGVYMQRISHVPRPFQKGGWDGLGTKLALNNVVLAK